MTERFYPPFARFFTSDLKTLPGALLYFYINGTTTPKTVYQDAAKTTPHANPVVAGTLGAGADQFPAIFLDGTYTVELKNSAGVTQPGWPQNNVGGERVEGQFDSYSSINNYGVGDLVTGSDGQRYESQSTPNLNRDPTLLANRPTYWKQIHLEQEYDAGATYEIGQQVIYSGLEYVTTAQTTGNTPSSNSAYWKLAAEFFAWNSSTTYASGAAVYVGYKKYISQQNTNLNHTPTDAGDTWWKPEWMTIDGLTKDVPLSGGGSLTAYRVNSIIDSGTYTFPAANSVPAQSVLIVRKSERYRASQPIVQRAGSDLIRNSSGTDTQLQFDWPYKTEIIFTSNGSNEWSY
jgi:hypothetical protein